MLFAFSGSILAGDFYGPDDPVAKIDYSLDDIDITGLSIWMRDYKKRLPEIALEKAPEGKISFIDYLYCVRSNEIKGNDVPVINMNALEINENNRDIWCEGMKDFEWVFNNNNAVSPLSSEQCQGYLKQFEQIYRVASRKAALEEGNRWRCTIS